jgi:hypothetical protein
VNAEDTFDVYFDGDTVSHVKRQEAPGSGRRRRRG